MAKVYYYPNCNTCKKALKWLEAHQVQVEKIHIVENTPTADEIKGIHEKSGLDIKKFFNTSGKVYRELGLKDRYQQMALSEIYQLLSENGMLIKRPIYVADQQVLVGFKEAEWESKV